jgi:PAS domain S-box-containing protein
MTIVLLNSGAVLLFTCTSFFAYEFFTFRQTTVTNLSTLGAILGNNSTAALTFTNSEDATEILAALVAEPHIKLAGLYDDNGKLFAHYPENFSADAFPTIPEADGYRLNRSYLVSFQPVVLGPKRLGTLYLKSDMDAMYDRFRLYGYIVLVVIVASLLLSYALSRGLQRQISQPILALTRTARAIADRGDYSVRAPRIGKGEFVVLTDALNQMLTRIDDGDRALRESEERFRSAMRYSAIGMALIAPDGRLLDVNQGLCTITGYGREEMLDRSFQTIIHSDDLSTNLHHLNQLLNGDIDVYRLEQRHLHKCGQVIWVDLSVSIVRERDGTPLYCIAQIQDITERKRDEELLRGLNSDLEQRVQERTRKLKEANEELESFSYSVSHDLRAPLRAIDGFSRILLEDHGDKLDENGKRLLDVVCGNTQNMGRLIDDLLAFSRLGRKQIEPCPVNMNDLASDVFQQLKFGLEDQNIQFNLAPLPDIQGDPALIRQVFVNLISNAAKYSRPRAQTVIEVNSRCENGDCIYYVRDNGVGFDMTYSKKLFGVFQRLHSVEEFEGTGVGLAIVQRIVHRHGGRVWAEGKVDEGATFYFSLPKEIKSNG